MNCNGNQHLAPDKRLLKFLSNLTTMLVTIIVKKFFLYVLSKSLLFQFKVIAPVNIGLGKKPLSIFLMSQL